MSQLFKFVILGGGGVGKSCLTLQFVQAFFTEDYDPTIEDSYRKQISVDGKTVLLDILDTAGQEEFFCMSDIYMRSGEGFIIVYSITSRASFEEAKSKYQKVLMTQDKDKVPAVLVGNKCDMEHERQVTKEEAKQWAKNTGINFFESSALSRLNVDEVFFDLTRQVRVAKVPQSNVAKAQTKKNKQQCTIF